MDEKTSDRPPEKPKTQYLVFVRPCGCGKPVVVEANHPDIPRLMRRGYKQTKTIWQ